MVTLKTNPKWWYTDIIGWLNEVEHTLKCGNFNDMNKGKQDIEPMIDDLDALDMEKKILKKKILNGMENVGFKLGKYLKETLIKFNEIIL